MTLDPYTDFWVSQDGARVSDEVRGNLEMHEAANKSGEPEQTFEDDDHFQSVRAAVDEVKNRSSDRDDWDGSREHRDALSEAYPQGDLNNYVLNKLGWHSAFQENPVAAREQYIRTWSRQSPFHPRVSAKPKAEEPPKDWHESGKAEWQADKDARDAYRQAVRYRADDEAFVSTAKLRQLVKERTGLSFSDFLSKCRQVDQASLDDPHGIANRFALFNGMPATQQQAEEIQSAVQQQHAIAEQRHAAANDLITQMGVNVLPEQVQHRMADFLNDAHKQLPDVIQDVQQWPTLLRHAEAAARNELRLEQEIQAESVIDQFRSDPANRHYDKLEGEIANLLTSGRVQRTGDMRADLQTAYDRACRQSPEVAAEKARRASRSVSGGPAPGARSGGSSSGSVEDDVRRAFYSGTI